MLCFAPQGGGLALQAFPLKLSRFKPVLEEYFIKSHRIFELEEPSKTPGNKINFLNTDGNPVAEPKEESSKTPGNKIKPSFLDKSHALRLKTATALESQRPTKRKNQASSRITNKKRRAELKKIAQKKPLTRTKKARRSLAQTQQHQTKTASKTPPLKGQKVSKKKPSSQKNRPVSKNRTLKGKNLKAPLQQASVKKKPSLVSSANKKGRKIKSKPASSPFKSAPQPHSKIPKQNILQEARGWKIPYIKRGGIFQKMKLKKGDLVLELEGQAIPSKKDLKNRLKAIIKEQKEFSLTFTRAGKNFVISYKIVPFKKKARIKVTSVYESPKTPGGKGSSSKSSKKTQTKNRSKKTSSPQALVPEKYKNRLQLAFISSLNSFVYEKPNFDSLKLFPLETGQKVLISKKVFRPPHKFGSFYKLFLVKPKKIVGYVSEAELIPKFLKNEKGGWSPNPVFKEALQQIQRDGVLDINLKDKVKKEANSSEKELQNPSPSSGKKTYIGLSVGLSQFYNISQKDILIGLKLSGYHLLLSSWNMDINALAAPYDFKFFYLDAGVAYPLVSSSSYHLFVTGGLKFSINQREQDLEQQISPGVGAGLSLLIPFHSKAMLRMDIKAEYSLSGGVAGRFGGGAMGALQTTF